jgi:intracellular sulfur oxidation DsrE/DsrF family protein
MGKLGAALAAWATACLLLAAPAAAEEPGDRFALQGVESTRIFWDIGVADAIALSNRLQVVRDTYQSLKRQGVQPRMAVGFRGQAVELLVTDLDAVPFEALGSVESLHQQMRELKRLAGVEFYACKLAMRRHGVQEPQLMDGVRVVTNIFIAVAGFHEQGYTRIPMME